MRTAILTLPLLFSSALPLSSQDAAPTEPAQAESFTMSFGWPRRGRVHVRYNAETDGQNIGVEYDARWEEVEGELRLHFANLNVLSVSGLKRGDAGFKKVARGISSMFQIAPASRITPQGEWIATESSLEAAKALKEAVKNANPGNKKAIDKALSLLKDPLVRDTLVSELTEQWSWWAGFWVGYEARVGEKIETEVETTGRAGTINASMSVECLDAPTRDGVKCARMRVTTAYDPAAMLRETLHTLREISPGKGGPKPQLRSVTRHEKIEGLYSIDTLRPFMVRWERRTAVDSGQGPKVRNESKTWVFEWPKAPATKREGR